MPKNSGWKRTSSYNAPKSRGGRGGGRGGGGRGGRGGKNSSGGRGRGSGLANAGRRQGASGGGSRPRTILKMRRDAGIREQRFEYVVVVHCELALPCPMQAVEAQQEDDLTPSHILEQQRKEREENPTPQFDAKQIVQLGMCVIHTPSGTACGKMQSFVKPPPNALPLSRYCCDVLDVEQEDVDAAPPLVDVLERAERWIKKVVRGGGDPDVVVDFFKRKNKKEQQEQDADEDEEEEEEEDDEEGADEEEQEEQEEQNDDDGGDAKKKAAPAAASSSQEDKTAAKKKVDDDDDDDDDDGPSEATHHKIILAADGIPSIAAIFQGAQQYMPPTSQQQQQQSDDNSKNSSDASGATATAPAKKSKNFSYLNVLSGAIFDRWLDSRDTFHRYFRVPSKMRLKLHEQLREVGLSFQGRSHCASDVCFNIGQLMLACMRKGCVYGYALESRTSHEQVRMHSGTIETGSTITVGGDGGGCC